MRAERRGPVRHWSGQVEAAEYRHREVQVAKLTVKELDDSIKAVMGGPVKEKRSISELLQKRGQPINEEEKES